MCFGHVGRGKGWKGTEGRQKKLSLSLPKVKLKIGDPLGVKGLKAMSLNPFPPMSDFIDFTYQRETLSS